MAGRPDWVKDVEHTAEGTLLVVKRLDGKLRGVRMPTHSLRGLSEESGS